MTAQLVADLRAVRAKIERPEAWTQGAWARTATGGAVPVRQPGRVPVCWCLGGALRAAAVPTMRWKAMRNAIVSLTAPMGITAWNDTPRRTHAEVLALIDRAIAMASI